MRRRLLLLATAGLLTASCAVSTSSLGSFSLLSPGRPGSALLVESYGPVHGSICDDEAEDELFALATRRALASEPRANALMDLQFEGSVEGTKSCLSVNGTAVRLRD